MPVPLNNVILKKSDLGDDSLTLLNQTLTNLTNKVNSLEGHAGPIKLVNHLDMQGKRIMGVAQAQAPNDVVTPNYGDTVYGPSAIQPQLDALGNSVMQTTRRVNDRNQTENYSSFLNGVLNTAPTTNTSTIAFGSPSGGTIPVMISAGFHQRVDGSIVPYASRTDILTLPTTFAIASISRTGGEVTLNTSSPNPFLAGQTFTVQGVGDPSFDGVFNIDTINSSTQFLYPQTGANASSTGGTIALGGVYYYYIEKGTNILGVVNNAYGTGDSWTNRLIASPDGQTIVAVVVLSGLGGNLINSAAGATPPASGAAVHLFGRL